MHSVSLDWHSWSWKSLTWLPADLVSSLFKLPWRWLGAPHGQESNVTDLPSLWCCCTGLSIEKDKFWPSMCLVPSLGRPNQFFDLKIVLICATHFGKLISYNCLGWVSTHEPKAAIDGLDMRDAGYFRIAFLKTLHSRVLIIKWCKLASWILSFGKKCQTN